MISVIKVTDGSFNIFGVEDGMFVLQGNISKDQLNELRMKVVEALKAETKVEHANR